MASDETRRVLKLFGVAMTNFEDAATPEERAKWDRELGERLQEVQTLIQRLRTRPESRNGPGAPGEGGPK